MQYSFLYVIAPADEPEGPVKLGISANPYRRLGQLQTGHSKLLRLYHTETVEAPTGRLVEGLLHRDVRRYCQHGEWFNMSVEEAIGHVRHAVICYDGVEDLAVKVRERRI